MQDKMTKSRLEEIVSQIEFVPGAGKDPWRFVLHDKGDGFLLQIIFDDVDVDSGLVEAQHCRKWYISSYSTETEVVRTAWKAVLAAVEHEAAERFKYRGVRVENPHTSIQTKISSNTALDIRK